MKLICFAYFRDILGKNELTWDTDSRTLGGLLGELSGRYGRPFRRWVYEENSEKMSHMVIILVNGKDARDLQGLDTPIKPEDTICLFPPLAGG